MYVLELSFYQVDLMWLSFKLLFCIFARGLDINKESTWMDFICLWKGSSSVKSEV